MIHNQKRLKKVQFLKKTLERVAFASLVADIAISITTLASLWLGQAYTVGVLFVINYILIVIVAISLALMFSIGYLLHSHRLGWIIHFFRFNSKW